MNAQGNNIKLWVIGADGLLGQALLRLCADRGLCVYGTGKKEADITLKEILTVKALEISPTHIINCAAFTDVDAAQVEYEKAWNVNAKGAQNVAEMAYGINARLIHISTDFVFNGSQEKPYKEEENIQPVNAYGMSKGEGEKLVFSAHPNACVIRTSWLFGKGGKNFLSSLLDWLKTRDQISVIDDQWGCPTYAPDLAEAIIDLLDEEGIFHFANLNAASRFEIARFAFEEMRRQNISIACKNVLPVSKEVFPVIAPRPSHSILSTEKYTRVTSKRPRLWQDTLKEFIYE
jgi:dTDP-4-dehydrorhamnose reductase